MNERVKITAKRPNPKRENLCSKTKKTPFSQSAKLPIDKTLHLQKTIGNRAVQRLIEKLGVRSQESEVSTKIPEKNNSLQTKPFPIHITPLIQRQAEEEEKPVQTKGVSVSLPNLTNTLEDRLSQRRGSGLPLPQGIRRYMEPRFGADFSSVRVHADTNAVRMSRELNAQAFTYGRDIYFGGGRYSPDTSSGPRLLAHELTHVVQQSEIQQDASSVLHSTSSRNTIMRRLWPWEWRRHRARRRRRMRVRRRTRIRRGGKTTTCGGPSYCPASYCRPYSSRRRARWYRRILTPFLLTGIAARVNSRVLGLWRLYLYGGSSPLDLSNQFGKDFTYSVTTAKTTNYLIGELKKDLRRKPPVFPTGKSMVTINIASRVNPAIHEIGRANGPREMNFNVGSEVPGNIAGGIATNQTSCPIGAKPSPFNDERTASGTITVFRYKTGDLLGIPKLKYKVRDTIDFCPGDCGSTVAQIATVPMSRMEASGISGDVPFVVEFPSPWGFFLVKRSKSP